MDDLENWRPEFPILSRSVYLINNSLGAMPRKTADSLAEYATAWATRGVRAWEDRWWEMAKEVGDRIGAIIGAPEASVSMHENVTTAQMVVLSTLPVSSSRRKIVCLEMTARLLELVDRYGFTSVASRDPEHLAGTVAVQVPDGMAVSHALKDRDFLVDYRPGVGIRISPHFYNTFGEIDAVMAEMHRIVSRKEYADRSPARSLVT